MLSDDSWSISGLLYCPFIDVPALVGTLSTLKAVVVDFSQEGRAVPWMVRSCASCDTQQRAVHKLYNILFWRSLDTDQHLRNTLARIDDQNLLFPETIFSEPRGTRLSSSRHFAAYYIQNNQDVHQRRSPRRDHRYEVSLRRIEPNHQKITTRDQRRRSSSCLQ